MTYQQKLEAAIEWLRSRNGYALEVPLGVRIYKPVFGHPLEWKK